MALLYSDITDVLLYANIKLKPEMQDWLILRKKR